MGRWGKFNAEDIGAAIRKWLGADKIPELQTGTEKVVKTQKKAQDITLTGDKAPVELIDNKLIERLSKAVSENRLPPELFPNSFDSFKNSLWYKVDNPADIDALIELVGKTYKKTKLKYRRGDKRKGVLKDSVVKELADELNIDIKTIQNRKIGEVYNVEQMMGAINLLKNFRVALGIALKKAVSEHAGTADKAFAMQMVQTYSSILHQVMGARAELGRSFRILREMKHGFSQAANEEQAFKLIFEKTGGKDLNEQKLEALYMLIENGKGMAHSARQINLATNREMLFQIFYNNLLSGIDTQVVNTGAGLILQQFHHFARFSGAVKGSIHGMVDKNHKGLTIPMAASAYYGYFASMMDGLRVFASSLLTGKSIDTFSKIPIDDSIKGGKITTRNLTYNTAGKISKKLREKIEQNPEFLAEHPLFMAVDALLDISTRYAPRLMKSADDMMKYIFYRSELHTHAYRKVLNEVESGITQDKDFFKRVNEILNDPIHQAPSIRIKALDMARDTVLQRDLDEFGKMYHGWLKEHKNFPGSASLGTMLKIITPFFTTLYNLTKVGFEMTPGINLGIGYAMKGSRLYSMLHSTDAVTRDMAIGNLLMSHMMAFTTTVMAMNGYQKGGDPVHGDGKDHKYLKINRVGVDEYSVIIPWSRIDKDNTYKGILHDGNDRAYKIDRLDPSGQWLAIGYAIAQATETHNDQEMSEAILRATMAIAEKNLSSSFAVNFADFIEIFTQGFQEQNAEAFMRNVVKFGTRTLVNFIPTKSRMRMNIDKMHDLDNEGNIIARKGDLTDFFKYEDENGNMKTFVDNGDGTYFMTSDGGGLEGDFVQLFLTEMRSEIKKRSDRTELPVALTYWGVDAKEELRPGGTTGVFWSPVKMRDMSYNQQSLIESGLFTVDDLSKSIPLLFRNEKFDAFANARTEDGQKLFSNTLNIVGVNGELERLNMGLQTHPKFISIRGSRIPLNNDQYYDYIKLINGDFSVLPKDLLDNVQNYISPEYYDMLISNKTLNNSLKELMTTEAYYMFGSDDDAAVTSREKLIMNMIDFYRHGKPEQYKSVWEESQNLRVNVDGPDKLLLLKYPDLKFKALNLVNTINNRNIKPLREVIN